MKNDEKRERKRRETTGKDKENKKKKSPLTGTGEVCFVVLTTRIELEQQSDTQEEHNPDFKNK